MATHPERYTVYNSRTDTLSEMTKEEIVNGGREPFVDLSIEWSPILATGRTIGRTIGYMQREHIFEHEDRAHTLYSLQVGQVDLLLPKNKQSEGLHRLRTLYYPGELFGTEIFSVQKAQQQHRYTAIARTPCQVTQINHGDMMSLFMENSVNAKRFRFQLLQQLIMQENVLGDMSTEEAYRSAQERLAIAINSKLIGGKAAVTQDELANEINSTRNYVNLLIRNLRKQKIITTTYGKVLIIDPTRFDVLVYGE